MDDKQLTTATEKDYGISTLAELWKRGIDVENAPAERPRRPYSQVSWVYICLNKILDTASGISLVLSLLNDDIVESGPAYDFLFANEKMPLDEFLQQTIGYLALFKECYWIYLGRNGIAPTDIMVAGPDQLKPVVRNGVLVGYELRLPGRNRIPLFEEDVHPLLGFNPDSVFHGIGPLLPGSVTISSSYQAALYNEASLANGARVSTVLTVPPGVKLAPEEIEMYKAQFKATHGGARNAGKTFLATGGIDVKTLSQTMAELQMIDLRRFDATEICALFGVPPEIVGLNSEAQYAHGPATQRFITDTISPLLSFVARHITSGILQKYRFKQFTNPKDASTYLGKSVTLEQSRCLRHSRMKLRMRQTYRSEYVKAAGSGQALFAWFSIEDHPAIQEMLRARAEKLMSYVDKGVPLNQVIDAGDLPFEHVAWGDDWWISAGQVTARMIQESGMEASIGEDLPEEPTDEEEGKAIDPNTELMTEKTSTEDAQKKARILMKYYASFAGLEKEFLSAIRSYLRRQKNQMLEVLHRVMADLKSVKAPDAGEIVMRVVFDLATENGKLKAIHKTFFQRGLKLGAAQTLSEASGLEEDKLVSAARQAAQTRTAKNALTMAARKIQNINTTTKNRIARALTEGLKNNESLAQLSKRIREDASFGLPRAKRIARTSVSGAVSAGRFEGLKVSGTEMKRWLSARDPETVRKTHRDADSKYTAAPIPVSEPFIVGGASMMYPGDPAGPPAETANCRCMVLAARVGGKSLGLDHYDRFVKFTDYHAFKSFLTED